MIFVPLLRMFVEIKKQIFNQHQCNERKEEYSSSYERLIEMNVRELDDVPTKTIVKTFQDSKCNICFEILYTRHFTFLFNYCIKLTQNKDDAYDLATEAFIKASEKIHLLKKEEFFKSWLFRIARNLFLDKAREKKRKPIFSIEDSFDLADDITDLELKINQEASIQQLMYLLDQIEPKSKDILVAKYLHNNSIAEIKNELGITESATKMRLKRAKNKIVALAS